MHTTPETAPTKRRVLNLKAIVLLLGTAFVLNKTVSYVHGRQMVRTTDFVRESGQKALDAGQPLRALDWFDQYLALRPGDDDVQNTLSQLLEKHAPSSTALHRAFQINERLLMNDKSRGDIRLRQVDIAVKLRRFSDAATHLKLLRESRSDAARVWYYSGVVAHETGDMTSAEKYISHAITLANPPAEAFGLLADIRTRQFASADEAEELLTRMISITDSAESRMIRANWFSEQQRHELALTDLWKALEHDPASSRCAALVLKTIGTLAKDKRGFDSATHYGRLIAHLRPRLEARPGDASLRLYVTSAMWSVGKRSEAIQCLRDGISHDPRRFELSEALIDFLISDRRYQQAQEIFDHLPERSIDRGRHEFMRGRLLMAQKKWTEALGAFEMAIGFSPNDAGLGPRARTCLAICRRETGDSVAAVDAYRSLLQSNPEFVEGRIGIASAYLQADQTDMAIAEYRQLLHVKGVPAFLANLLIRHNLNQPAKRRNWKEVTDLLRDSDPVVTDEAERCLLQADLLFAQGRPARAMEHLQEAAVRLPGRQEIARALQRVTSNDTDGFRNRIESMLKDDPANEEAHLCFLRMRVAAGNHTDVEVWLDDLLTMRSFPTLSQPQRLHIVATTTTRVAADEIRFGRSGRTIEVLLNRAEAAWRQLTALFPEQLGQLVRFLAQHRSLDAAMNLIAAAPAVVNSSDGSTSPQNDATHELKASCWLECLRFAIGNRVAEDRIATELITLIHSRPNNMNLRLAYAESRLMLQKYPEAEELLLQIASYDKHNSQALGRLAWIAAFVNHNAEKALQFSTQAADITPSDPAIRSIRGLALAESQQSEAGLEVLNAIPAQERSPASYLYEARALFLHGQKADSETLLRELIAGNYETEFAPAEKRLLETLQQQQGLTPAP